MSDKQETGIKNGISVPNSDASISAGTIRSRQHSINRQSVNDFEKALQRAPQYNKTLQDYRSGWGNRLSQCAVSEIEQ